jgi:hypothetical protein
MELIMSDWTKEQAAFLVKIGQLPPATPEKPATKPTPKKDEE